MAGIRALWLVLALAGCGGTSTDSSINTPPPPPPPGGGNPAANASVAMTSAGDEYGSTANAFSPSAVTILRNGSVTWTNATGVPHNVTFAPATGVPTNVANMQNGSAARTFNTAGSFAYQCTNHVGMSGSVTVQ